MRKLTWIVPLIILGIAVIAWGFHNYTAYAIPSVIAITFTSVAITLALRNGMI